MHQINYLDILEELQDRFNLTVVQASNVFEWLDDEDDLQPDVEETLYSFYMDSGDMPYGVAKARTGDPQEWIRERLTSELEL